MLMIETNSYLKHEVDEIDELVKEALKYNFLSDKMYLQIITKIGKFDDQLLRLNSQVDKEYVSWAKQRLSRICQMLVDQQETASGPSELRNENLTHPNGDYYNEDNSFMLSREVKKELKEILSEQYHHRKR